MPVSEGPFSPAEIDYLTTQELGRMATVQPDGTLQVSPVGFSYNAETASIDVYGFNMSRSRKYRNIEDNGRVAFVVDDVPSIRPRRVRCLEIRGYAETVAAASGPGGGLDSGFIRIHPRRIISFGIEDTDQEPHEMTPRNRNVA
ncbi:MAG TPA: PPOX class F420-dependent oxidoreductase [Mycobacteriales bacterium]|jgi:pyridoxamine 5'-phosphate oxidase family protein|nr:PPOX class F420-dependent oxidoreductase [Mycobacteriales bacterium]